MHLIKKIISWLISLFHMLFKSKKKNTKVNKVSQNSNTETNKTNKVKIITGVIDETIPSYMFLPLSEKKELISKINELKKEITKRSDNYFNSEISNIIDILDKCNLKDNSELKEMIESFKNNLNKSFNKNTNKQFELLVNYLPKDKKDDISLKYNSIYHDRKVINENINNLDITIDKLEKRNITLIEKNSIEDKIDNFINSKNTNLLEDVNNINSDILYTMKNINKNIIDKVKIEYKKINYVTLTTELLDEIQLKFKKIESEYNSHLYNKYYYEREINKIKKHILELKELKNKPEVYSEILKLRKELYTKSKDKYDILYNNEVFMNINEQCDNLIGKVNAKVVDIKKEKKEKEAKKDKNKEYLKKIILRFKDMELARELIIGNEQEDFDNYKEMILYIKNIYEGYSDIELPPFNFERNKQKTELIILFNKLNKVNCHLKKEKYLPIEHINFRMNDILDAVNYKKEELSKIMLKEYNIDISNKFVDEKINNLMKKEKSNKVKTLVKNP